MITWAAETLQKHARGSGGGAVGAMVVNVEAQQKYARGSGEGQLGITFAAAEIRGGRKFR